MEFRNRIKSFRMIPAGELRANPRNWRDHPAGQTEALRAILQQVGWAGAALAYQTPDGLTLVDGHLRRDLADNEPIPVLTTDLTEDEAVLLLATYDPISAMADMNATRARELYEQVQTDNPDIQELLDRQRETAAALLAGEVGTNGLTDPDDVPEPPAEPITKVGDLWLLGKHRLLCADSTKRDDVGRLMGGEKAGMAFTDPPYNVAYGESKNPRHRIREITNDKQSESDWLVFCGDVAEQLKLHCEGDLYVWGASSPDGMRARLALIEYGAHWSATIIWKKQQLVLSPAKYQRIYEPCFYGWFGKSSFVADRKQVEVWEVDRPHNSDLHPTMKPVELAIKAISNSSNSGDVVLDLFVGSGTTIIAAEQTGRRCFAMEIEPRYVDVCVKRWEQFTGKTAVLEKP